MKQPTEQTLYAAVEGIYCPHCEDTITTALCACGANNTAETPAAPKFTAVTADENGNITIPTADISATARFFNYDADGVTVQLVALRDADNKVHAAFNTCQSCSPSPNAFYQQNGNVLQCTNCGFTFAPEEVGITKGGCNPWPIEGAVIGENEITVPAAAVAAMRDTFVSWGGPTGE